MFEAVPDREVLSVCSSREKSLILCRCLDVVVVVYAVKQQEKKKQ